MLPAASELPRLKDTGIDAGVGYQALQGREARDIADLRQQDGSQDRADAPESSVSSAAITPSPGTSKLLWGVELVLLGFLFLGFGISIGGWRKGAGTGVMGPGAAAVLAGLFPLVTTQLRGG